MLYLDAKPNAAHLKLAELEAVGKLRAVITQNIDGLNQAAGSKCVYELHGSVLRNYCEECGNFYGAEYILTSEGVPNRPADDQIRRIIPGGRRFVYQNQPGTTVIVNETRRRINHQGCSTDNQHIRLADRLNCTT